MTAERDDGADYQQAWVERLVEWAKQSGAIIGQANVDPDDGEWSPLPMPDDGYGHPQDVPL